MNIRNRMADVVKLRCNACQDFLKLILNDKWQQSLYNLVRNEVKNNTPQKIRYIGAYTKMRAIGPENYTVDLMDITIISAIVDASFANKFAEIKKINFKTHKALTTLRDDRNLNDHSNENEKPDELYLRGLLALSDLKKFIKAVDEHETTIIEDNARLSYFKKYITEIELLEKELDKERIDLIQWKEEIDKDLFRIKRSDNPSYEWGRVFNHYFERYMKYERNDYSFKKYIYFIVHASDNGIEQAHSLAASHFIDKKDYSEAENRLFMWYSSKKEFDINGAQDIVKNINDLIKQKYKLTSTIQTIIDGLTNKGVKITKTPKGLFEIDAN